MISELFVENKKAPPQTKIFLSQSYYNWQILIAIFWISIGVYFLFTKYWIFGIVFILYILFRMKDIPKFLKLVKRDRIQIELSVKGISLKGGRSISWSSISEDKVILESNHSAPWNAYEYLTFTAKSRKFKIFVNHLDTSSSRLEYLLKIYRKRSEKEKN